ncbi:hypothetical protein HPB49_014090 [Dermacentor silvarum]|uniref:Uncharacterized protein n=1 Tax=Dermacentor silvarum TaxID=543639 RepID=A0ACB8D669_DERSI|nr:hypothetical protein HPB49_014090 [Dermacentor silvarum]
MGTRLVPVADKFDLKLETLPLGPTRLGNNVSLDTYPDLTFTKNVEAASWENLHETLGSDHYIVSLSTYSPKIRRQLGTTNIIDW